MARMVVGCLIMGSRIGSVVGPVVVVSDVREVGWRCVGWVIGPMASEVSVWFDLVGEERRVEGMYNGRTYALLEAWYPSVMAIAASSQWVFGTVTPPAQSTAGFALISLRLAW